MLLGRMSTCKEKYVFIHYVEHVSSNRLFVGEEFQNQLYVLRDRVAL